MTSFAVARPIRVARDGYRSLIALVALMDDVRRSEPDTKVDMPVCPARSRLEGVAFIEFASRGGDAVALARLLQTLGLARVGQHKTKQLTLWQQGEIRILINAEPGDLAARIYNAHGTSIYVVGLSVASASDTTTRAALLDAEPFAQNLSPAQADIPAIRGLGAACCIFWIIRRPYPTSGLRNLTA